jgi:site-specific recombinase XerC
MNSSLATAIADFLAHKRALGRKYQTEEATLRLLLAFADQHEVGDLRGLTPCLLEEFVASRPRQRARSFNHLVGVLGCFLDWALTQQRLDVSPWRGTRRRDTAARLPFFFDVAQARRLLEAAAALPDNPRATGRGRTYHAIFVLCYGLGLRAGEACGLRLDDVDLDRQLLVVRGGKFGKHRQVPVHSSTVEALNSYGQARDRLLAIPATPAWFVSTRGTRLDQANLPHTFACLVEAAGIQVPARQRRPRLHDLRH